MWGGIWACRAHYTMPPESPQAQEERRVRDHTTGAAAGSLGKDLPPTRIPWGSRWAGRGEAAATVGAASF